MPDSTIVRRLIIRGRVQGVCYRASAQEEALRLGLHGWVRNRRDGAVEAVVAGPEDAVERFVAWARNGPPAATVVHIEIEVVSEPPAAESFAVRPTA